MRDSKAIKSMPWRVRRDIEDFGFWQGIKYWTIYPIESFFNRYKERISRSWAFAKIAWLNYDFDAHTIWELMAFKLRRVLDVLENYAHLEQDSVDLLALKEAIAICDRLQKDDYEWNRHIEHDKKWGDMPDWDTKPSTELNKKGKPKSYEIIFKDRPLVKTPEDKEQERKDFRESWDKAAVDKANDIDRLCFLLKNHLGTWWD